MKTREEEAEKHLAFLFRVQEQQNLLLEKGLENWPSLHTWLEDEKNLYLIEFLGGKTWLYICFAHLVNEGHLQRRKKNRTLRYYVELLP